MPHDSPFARVVQDGTLQRLMIGGEEFDAWPAYLNDKKHYPQLVEMMNVRHESILLQALKSFGEKAVKELRDQADVFRAWMEKKPVNSAERTELSHRAAEWYSAADAIRSLIYEEERRGRP